MCCSRRLTCQKNSGQASLALHFGALHFGDFMSVKRSTDSGVVWKTKHCVASAAAVAEVG